MQTVPVESIFSRAWTLLARNPLIVVPGIVVGAIAGIIQSIVTPHVAYSSFSADGVGTGAEVMGSGLLGMVVGGFVSVLVGILSYLIAQTYTTGMAGAAWSRGTATLADGQASFREDAGRLFGAIVLLAVLAVVLAAVTFGIGALVLMFFALYVVPAVVLDNDAAIAAFRVSATIARRRAVSTLIIVVMLIAIDIVIGMLATPLLAVPFLGPILTGIVFQAVAAYATLVIVGEYLSVRNAPDITAGQIP